MLFSTTGFWDMIFNTMRKAEEKPQKERNKQQQTWKSNKHKNARNRTPSETNPNKKTTLLATSQNTLKNQLTLSLKPTTIPVNLN